MPDIFPKSETFIVVFSFWLIILIISFQIGLTLSHWRKTWIIVSSTLILLQKEQYGESLLLILNKKSLKAIALWKILK